MIHVFSKYIQLVARLLLLVILVANCAPRQHPKEQHLTKEQQLIELKQEEAILIAQLEAYVQPAKWRILNNKTLRECKEHYPALKHQLKVSKRLKQDLRQAYDELKNGNLDAQEEIIYICRTIEVGGFKAATSGQGMNSLKHWIQLLENLEQQYQLEKNNR
jgi:hypothetical protein